MRKIEQTFAAIEKVRPPRSWSTVDPPPISTASPARKNNTRYTFNDIIGANPDLLAALTATRGNAAAAALRRGISPQLMSSKLKRFGVDRRQFKDC